jgi:nitrogen fixation/metabolism regulation signal transduction histidine kinase
VQQFESNDRVLVFLLIGFGVLLSVVLTMYGIVLTHKVAGPLFKVTLYLDKIRDGKLGQVYALRKGDELVEFFDHFKAAHDALRKQEQGDIELLGRAAEKLSDEALKAEIAAVIAQKVESLK